RWVRYLVSNEPAAIDSWLRFDRIDGRSCPGGKRRGHSHRVEVPEKGETRRAADIVTAVGGIVVHVAFPGMGLAPGILIRADVLHFGVIGRARIQRRV